jgi:tRNA (guanine-N7-)-methyltransferase
LIVLVFNVRELRPEYKPKSIRSYVIRSGRVTEAQKRALNDAWPQYGLSISSGLFDQQRVFGRCAPLVVEVGFGMGDSLLTMAASDTGVDFIGVEVHAPGVGRLINGAVKNGIHNLRVYMADALDVLQECVIDNSITRFQLFFPDPWHKKKHHKRRIVQPYFANLVRKKLVLGGVCHFVTDWQDYANEMMSVMTATDGFSNQLGEYMFSARPSYRPLTKFEQRGERLGHRIWELLFERIA